MFSRGFQSYLGSKILGKQYGSFVFYAAFASSSTAYCFVVALNAYKAKRLTSCGDPDSMKETKNNQTSVLFPAMRYTVKKVDVSLNTTMIDLFPIAFISFCTGPFWGSLAAVVADLPAGALCRLIGGFGVSVFGYALLEGISKARAREADCLKALDDSRKSLNAAIGMYSTSDIVNASLVYPDDNTSSECLAAMVR